MRWISLAVAAAGSSLVAQASDDCPPLIELDPPMSVEASFVTRILSQGIKVQTSSVLSSDVDQDMIYLTHHSNDFVPTMDLTEGILTIGGGGCSDVAAPPVAAPTADSAAPQLWGFFALSSLWAPSWMATALLVLSSSSYMVRGDNEIATNGCSEVVQLQFVTASAVDDSSALEAENAQLKEQVAMLEASVKNVLLEQIGFTDFNSSTLPVDVTLERISNMGRSAIFNGAGFDIYGSYSPEAQFFLNTIEADTRVPEMQGDVFQFPEEGNMPEDVNFTLPPVPDYTGPTDLYHMPILDMAALIESQTVSCVEVVQAFIDRLTEFDPYLGIVATPLYDTALTTAASHDALLASGTYVSPLMCIPFGVKDHHQIYDDDPTMYGSILFAGNIQSTKSSMITQLLNAGAIPIAKMQLGTFAWSSANGWGECMSPYLNGPGCGSSCGSASGAALGAFPFAVSEETSGSIACPASASLISGHIGSYGSFSRGGAGLLCAETDHLGFHSRFLSDYGVIFNYARTGDDPLDGDAVMHDFVNPADVDVTQLRVMIIEGEGAWEFDEEEEDWNWNNVVRQSYGKTAWHWPERVKNIKAALDAAGVPYDTFSSDAAGQLWSFDETATYFDCATPQIDVMMAGGPWAQLQECEYCFQNSKWKVYPPRNVPKYIYRYMSHCMKEMGKMFLNDQVWDTYDVIIGTHSSTGGDYPLPGGSFEQWVRTAKTFVMDYYEALPCATAGGNTIEGAYTTLTAKPFEDYKNFAIGALIQDTSSILYPDDAAIKAEFEGRSRCPFAFYETYNDMLETCPTLNTDGAPPGPNLRGIDAACTPGDGRHHLPEAWANETYVPPYEMDDPVPDRALWRWDEYEPVACSAVCPYVPKFCELKGIVCDARRLEQEQWAEKPSSLVRGLETVEDYMEYASKFNDMHLDGGEF